MVEHPNQQFVEVRPEPLLLRVDEAARLCGIGRSKMYELVAQGAVPSIAIGRARRVPLDRLRRWIDEQAGIRSGEAA